MRVAFLVDGFNLYHSLDAASRALNGQSTKWLDLVALCRDLLPQIHHSARLESVHFFSAPPDHMEQLRPGALDRHRAYVGALRAGGVVVELGKFREKPRTCPSCGVKGSTHEEKETDVAIAVRMMERLWNSRCDAVFLVTADSDMAPALREAACSFPDIPVYCGFPFGRGSKELRALARQCFRIRKDRYADFQLPDTLELGDGSLVRRPAPW